MTVELKKNNQELLLSFSDADNGEDDDALNSLLEQIELWKKDGGKNVTFVLPENINASTLLTAQIFKWAKLLKNVGLSYNFSSLPDNLQQMLALALNVENKPPLKNKYSLPILDFLGKKGLDVFLQIKRALSFIHETNLSLIRFFTGKAIFRRNDFLFIFADCSYKAVGIISLVSFLVGLILAFVGALQLRTFGAGIYVASMVSIGMTRIMAAIMVGIIMAGRTGSSYAATLGTMQVNEEIDALKTLGIKISDYLITPRLLSLVLTIPFLTMLADVLGIFGGAVVGVAFLDISSSSYFDFAIKALSLKNILVGLMHSVVYGIIISLCGCYEGLNAGRDADSVGKATTSAVVTALVWMIVATGILTVLLEVADI